MKIINIDYNNKRLEIGIPLTKHTGKIRIKERNSYTDFGLPVATRSKPFNENMYIEWQISYDLEFSTNNIDKISNSFYDYRKFEFIAYNGKRKMLYELSEYLLFFRKINIISSSKIEELIRFSEKIKPNSYIDRRYSISKTYPDKTTINGIEFLESSIIYPHLIHDFDNGFFIIAEITIREKQRAIGVQPMLFVCFPVKYLKDEKGRTLIGRKANKNEIALFEINKENYFIILECMKIFSVLSEKHNHDIQRILKVIKQNT